jgi:hypothetical protein
MRVFVWHITHPRACEGGMRTLCGVHTLSDVWISMYRHMTCPEDVLSYQLERHPTDTACAACLLLAVGREEV